MQLTKSERGKQMRKFWGIMILIVSLVALVACDGDDTQASKGASSGEGSGGTLSWAAGAQGGGWYTMAGGLSTLIGNESDINISTIPGGSMQNMPFIANNEAQLAWMQPPFINAGLTGEDPFTEAYENVSIIGNGFGTNHFHFIVSDKYGVESIDEIFEKNKPIKIAVTPVNNSDEWVFRKFLEYYDTDYEGIKNNGGKVSHGSYQEQVDALKNGNVDAVFAQVALPAATVQEIAASKDVRILPMTDELMTYLEQFGLEKDEIPAGTYDRVLNGDQDISTASMGTTLTVNSDLDEETVYEITKIINENTDKLPNIHASLKDYSVEKATKNLTADLHPGAAKYYEEIGQKPE